MKALMISPVPTDPLTAGNRARVLNLFTALEHLGHDVTFAYVPYEHADFKTMEKRLGHRLRILQAQSPPFQSVVARVKRKMRRELGLPSAHLWGVDEWFDDGLIPQIVDLQKAESFETVLMEYVFLSKLASLFPKYVRTVLDTHDIFGDLHRHYSKNGLSSTWFATTPESEIRALQRVDAVIAIQNQEAEYLRRRGLREVFCVGHLSTNGFMPLPDPGGTRILFVGSANPMNIQGLEWFVGQVLPEIRAEIPSCELAIAGPAGQTRIWPDGVLVLGELESLVPAYTEAIVVVNPVIFGTGLAVKVIEALSYGKPVVASVAGARGLDPELAAAIRIAQNHSTFARHIVELLQNKAARVKLSQKAAISFDTWRRRQCVELDAAIRGNKRSLFMNTSHS
jgi:polysaccharide biosynthesis protein PslH